MLVVHDVDEHALRRCVRHDTHTLPSRVSQGTPPRNIHGTLICSQEDQIYWSRVQLYNTRTDVQILADLEVKKCYWPIELQNVSTLDVPFVCATARSRYYASAIDTLQSLR